MAAAGPSHATAGPSHVMAGPSHMTAGQSHSHQEDLFNCSVCLDEFEDPRSLNCLHTFCLSCLDDIVKHLPARNYIVCPVCQEETPLPEAGVIGLKRDFKIEQMKELLDTTKKTNEPHGKLCEVCKGEDKKVATLHCALCMVYFCARCSEKHDENVLFRDHTMNAVPQYMTSCMVHMGHAVGYVCECDPAVLLCALCIMEHDKEHNVQSISQARANLLLNTLVHVNDTKKQLQGRMNDLTRMANRYGTLLINVEREIKAQGKRIMAEVTRQENEMIGRARDQVKETLKKYQVDETKGQLRYTEKVEQYINQVLNRPDDGRYHKDAKLQREFMRMRESIRPKAFTETGIVFVPDEQLPRIHLGKLEGFREVKIEK